jgi:hypothetical protein
MKSGSQVTRAAAACVLILNAAMSYGAVPEVEIQRLNDSSRKESSMSGSATTNVPEAPRNVLQLKDADDLMAKYVRLANLTIDEFTPEAVEAIFGIKFGPRQDIGGGDFAAGYWLPIPKESTANQSPMSIIYEKRTANPGGWIGAYIQWLTPPPLRVDYQKLKTELERHGWVISGPSPNIRGGGAINGFVRSEGNKKWGVDVHWTQSDGVFKFEVGHNVAVGASQRGQ